MYDEKDPGDVFAIPDLWRPSELLDDPLESHFIFAQLNFDDADWRLPDVAEQCQQDDLFFSIPELTLGPAEEAPVPTSSESTEELTATSDGKASEEVGKEEVDDYDIWIKESENTLEPAKFQSWDAFTNPDFHEPETAYLTEAGPRVFDTALAAVDDFLHVRNTQHVVVDSKVFNNSVLALGLGRNSIFFDWNNEKSSFSPTLDMFRISGHTAQTLHEFLIPFYGCGNTFRFLQQWIDNTYSSNKSPGRIALAESVSTVLSTIQSHISGSVFSFESILQLQAIFQPVHSVLSCFKRVVSKVRAIKSDEEILSMLFEEVQLLEHRTDFLKDVILEILSRVSRPWLEFASGWLGLQRELGVPLTKSGPGKSFVKVDDKEWIDEAGLELNEPDFVLDFEMVPSFMSLDDAQAMFEVGRSLRFLRTHHASHPLSRIEVVESARPPMLQWHYSWQDILDVEAKALRYEKDLTAALRAYSESDLSSQPPGDSLEHDLFQLEIFGKPESEMESHVLASIDVLNSTPQGQSPSEKLAKLLHDALSTYSVAQDDALAFSPPISLAPLLSFNPVISAQARIVNTTCMRLFFESHNLRDHLLLQKDFQLLGNGVFSSRLSHALFDPELETAERQRGVARTGGVMGLRLGGRDTWPPASSELRLALMGVLTESYNSQQISQHSRVGGYLERHGSLPGDLSFAVRDMSEDEILKCMDPNSIEALDFLRLSYKAPAPLETIITPIILYKYDQLFKLLLRTLRMLYVVTALFRSYTTRTSHSKTIDPSTQKFRLEAHHFISTLCSYFFHTGIESTWQIFERKLDEVELRLKNQDVLLNQNEGLDKLREYHERVLDRIMFALLLRKRQKPVMKLLEEIFTLILQFSKVSSAGGDEIKDIYGKFRKKVGVFITVCRGLSEKKGYGEREPGGRIVGAGGLFDGGDLVEENTIGQLVLRLEMSGYYIKGMSS
ncbi:Spc97 Spc98 family protein [Rutstroemia sp. NJR-2017a WRK4]|nr:Spc97 Spc98 family protein [Rutstroemia sp. NJR-2017a WRK4]